MKTKLLSFAIMAAAFATACSAPRSNNSTANADPKSADNRSAMNDPSMDHSKMDHGQMDHSMMNSSANAATADYDLQFLDTMIVHHQGAVDMAKLIPSKGSSEDLKKLGLNIVSSQEKEIAAMRAWREKWFGGKPAAINMEMAGMKDSMSGMDLKKLDTLSGKAFDVEFVKQMIPHHEGAVVMSKEALNRSQKDEIKTLATSIIREQQSEIQQMKGWLEEWK